MIGYFNRLRAARAASAVILPLVEGTERRKRGIAPDIWRQPYVIGFISTLITLIANRTVPGDLDGNRLGNVQLDAWSTVTGERDEQVGEDICMLSASQDAAFVAGCRNAGLFLTAYAGEPLDPADYGAGNSGDTGTGEDMQFCVNNEENLEIYGKGGAVAFHLWEKFFDSQLQ